MSLHGKEKIWFLINRLLDEREVTEAGQPVALHPMNDLNGHYEKMDFVQLTEKLEKEHKAIKLLNQVPTDQTNLKYLIELLPNFDDYVAELRKDPKYLDWIGEKPENDVPPKSEPISVNHARKNGVMTGKEKVQAVIEEINNKHQGLVTGNTVLLHSGNLEERGLQMHEQKQVLDILANDKKVIKYTAKNEYDDRASIHPRDQVDILEVSLDEAEANDMFDKLLEQQQYQVEVLPTFTKLADELLGDAELEHQKDVYLLRLFYNRAVAILDAVVSAGVLIEDDKLDFAYVRLTALIEDVMSKPTMKDWQKDAPELYETLLGNAEDIGEGWKYSRTEVLKYYAKLQKYWMLNSHVEFELDEKLTAAFSEIDELIAVHKKATREAADNWYKRTDAFAKDFRKRGVVINKEPKPQPNYPDDTASAPNIDQEPTEPDDTIISQDKVRFDAKVSKLTFDGKTCEIPDETIEYYICKLVFKNRKVAAKEDDILEYTAKSQDSQRAVYDAMLRINKKAREQLRIEKLLSYKAAKVRITTKYQ
jgi:hypothetical protein